MAKNIRWQIPFVSDIDKTKYRIDIYDEGTFTPVQLAGGPTPFVTNENNDTDFFAPVRGQTGTIEVVTKLPNGGTLNINDLLPANNIDHPVRLVSISGSTETIEWQGFMSCEAFSQNYTSVPDTFSFPILSVLEAMDSVQLNPAGLSGLLRIDYCLQTILLEIYAQSGIQCFTHVNYSRTDFNILQKYIDMTVMFERKEYNNENSTTYIVSGRSAKSALSRLCTYMGWVARENKTEISLQRIGEKRGAYRAPIDDLNMTETKYLTTRDIATEFADKWRGNDHKRTVSQGAKSVEVVAKLDKYAIDLGLPEFPTGDVSTYYNELNNNVESQWWEKVWWYMVASKNATAYSSVRFGYWALDKNNNGDYNCRNYGQSILTDVLAHMLQAMSDSSARIGQYYQSNPIRYYSGAFYAKESFEESETQSHRPYEGIHCVFIPYTIANESGSAIPPNFDPSQVGYILQISSVVNFMASSGYINLKAAYEMIYWAWAAGEGTHFALGGNVTDKDWRIGMRLKFGDMYWNGSSWQTTPCLFNARFNGGNFKGNWNDTMGIKETDGLLIPISFEMSGEVIIEIWPNASRLGGVMNNFVCEAFYKQLSVDYIPLTDDTLTDRRENHYFRLLGTNFSDDISINTELASSLNNQPSPSLIMNADMNPMTTLDYFVGTGTVSIRPEVDLLNRLAEYYRAARQRLELEVAHPTAAPLPLLKLNGIGDSKVYLPLSESRDWKADYCKLTCFETPN